MQLLQEVATAALKAPLSSLHYIKWQSDLTAELISADVKVYLMGIFLFVRGLRRRNASSLHALSIPPVKFVICIRRICWNELGLIWQRTTMWRKTGPIQHFFYVASPIFNAGVLVLHCTPWAPLHLPFHHSFMSVYGHSHFYLFSTPSSAISRSKIWKLPLPPA